MEIDIVIEEALHAGSEQEIRRALTTAARVMGIENAHVTVTIVGDAQMRKNVLAYPAPNDFPRPDMGSARDLGDIYINPGYIAAHGENLAFMAAHALLHCLGYDHGEERDTLTMEEKERAIEEALGKDPA